MADIAKDYVGIPRKMIPWYPTIDEAACTNCGVCAQTCKHGTFAVRTAPEKVVVVDSPYSCEVFCETCRFACPTGAISFPSRKSTRQILKDLRPQYPPAE
jgi:NAD-dependent dihydropyrimidine dehydrogenase PreA subunit